MLSRRFGVKTARVLLARVEGKYAELLSGSPRYSPRALQKLHFEKNILPAVSLYKILLMDGVDPQEALTILDEVLEAGVQGQKRMYSLLGHFPFFFDLLRMTLKPLMVLQYPKEGWEVIYPDLGLDVVGLDSHRCFYLQVLTNYDLPELTRHFCRLDDVLFEHAANLADLAHLGRRNSANHRPAIGQQIKVLNFTCYIVTIG